MNVKIEVKGLEDALKQSDEARKVVEDLVSDAVMKAGARAVNYTMSTVPVRTGRLMASYGANSHPVDRFNFKVSSPVEYAPYVEFGTSKMRAQPHLMPSCLRAAKEAEDDLAGSLK